MTLTFPEQKTISAAGFLSLFWPYRGGKAEIEKAQAVSTVLYSGATVVWVLTLA